MLKDDLQRIAALAVDRDQKHYAWIRQLLLLASGTLAALVAFRAGAQSTGAALWALRVAWVSLGLGILLGAAALHAEVWIAAALVKRSVAEALERASRPGDSPSPVVANKPALYKAADLGFRLSLLVAVVALVAHAVLRS